MDKGKHVESMHCLECNAYAGIKTFLVNIHIWYFTTEKELEQVLKTKGKVEISLSTEKQKIPWT